MKYVFVFLLALPLLSGCEPCDCQPTEEEPVVNCYTLRYEAENNGNELYNIVYFNGTGGQENYQNLSGLWEYEFDICTPYTANITLVGTDFGEYSVRIYLDDVLWKEANSTSSCTIPPTPLP